MINKIFFLLTFFLINTAAGEELKEISPDKALSPPVLINDLDLNETMKVMGRSFRQLKTAQSTAEMIEPAQKMANYAGQAEIIGLDEADDLLQQQYLIRIKALRQEIAKLLHLIADNDLEGARSQIAVLDQMRRSGHRKFKRLK